MVRDPSPAWRAQREYFLSIGLPDAGLDRYFNSGVLRASRQDWASIGKECLALVRTRGERFRFPDQDALNLCCGSRRLPMSLKWNFPIFLLNSGVQRSLRPAIYHFMSNPRPWQGSFAPWGRSWHAPYPRLIAQHPELARFLGPLPISRRIKYTVQQRFKQLAERRRYRRPDIQARIAAIEQDAVI
jgi:lipopolysaccharide biosynthesis glycosyltransferase